MTRDMELFIKSNFKFGVWKPYPTFDSKKVIQNLLVLSRAGSSMDVGGLDGHILFRKGFVC